MPTSSLRASNSSSSSAICLNPTCYKLGLHTCSLCGWARYCSKECQKFHWKSHKKGCSLKLADLPGFQQLWAESCTTIDAGRYNVSIPQTQEILQLALDSGMDPYDPQLSRIYHRLGHVYMGSGDYTSAEAYFKKAVDIAPDDDTEIVRGLIVFYLNVYNLKEAEPHCERYLERNLKKFGPESFKLAQPLRFLGLLHHRQKNYPVAIELLARAYTSWSNQFGPVHPDVQRVTNDLVEALQDNGEFDRAAMFAEQNYENATTFAPDARHLSISDSAWSFAKILIAKNGDLDKAAELLTQALSIREHILGPNATRVAEILLSIVRLHIRMDRCTEDDLLSVRRAQATFITAWGVLHTDALDAARVRKEVEDKLGIEV
jgi:tetratricopeptide (TPR) repeat protein